MSVPNVPLGKEIYSDPFEMSAFVVSSGRATYHFFVGTANPYSAQYRNHLINGATGVAEMGLIAGHYYAMRKYVEAMLVEGSSGSLSRATSMGILVGTTFGIYIPLAIKSWYNLTTVNLTSTDRIINGIADLGVLSLLISRNAILTPMAANENSCRRFPDTKGCPVPSAM